MKLLSTRALAQLWKLQESVRLAARERDRCMRILTSGRTVLAESAHRELWMDFSCAHQEYQYAVAQLAEFVRRHAESRGTGEQVPEPA